MKRAPLVLLSCLALLLGSFSDPLQPPTGDPPWREPWVLRPGFEMEIDSRGFTFPTAIAFIPNPGPDPMDPLYFVTELRGEVKVVTNDRTVLTFAKDFFEAGGRAGLEDQEDEFGLAGICLAPEDGYIFVTFTERRDGELFNNIIRFESEPQAFGLEPTDVFSFPEIFEEFPTGISHQIGGCEVVGDELFVGVGDGFNRYDPPLPIDSPLGKILRMSLDGQPLSDNPFFEGEGLSDSANYVWAYGFRNPFGIEAVEGQLFVADNGSEIDRFVEVIEGTDYLWNGSDQSIATKAVVVFPTGFGPAQMDYAPPDYTAFPTEYRSTFYAARSRKDNSGAFAIPLTPGSHEVSRVPYHFIGYRGPREGPFGGVVAALALGPDGLYFAPIVPDPSLDEAVVYRVYYTGEGAEAPPENVQRDPEALIETYACLGCHNLEGEGSFQAPSLDRDDLIDRLSDFLSSQEYADQLEELRASDPETYGPYEAAHELVVQAEGLEKIRIWISYRLVDPRFDDPDATMPNLDISLEEARLIADYLVPDSRPFTEQISELPATIEEWISSSLPDAKYRHIAFAFALGLLIGSVGITLRNKSR